MAISTLVPLEPVRLNEQQDKIFRDRYALHDKNDQLVETTVEQMWDRVARAIARAELNDVRDDPATGVVMSRRSYWNLRFRELLDDFKFVPGGRIMHGAGTGSDVTFYNCFQGDTRVHTDKGQFPIRDLRGTHNVLTQDGYKPAEFRYFGHQEIYLVTLANGDVIETTSGHEWIVNAGDGRSRERVPTIDLTGRSIPIMPQQKPGIDDDFFAGVRWGIVFGDGSQQYGEAHVCLFGGKRELARYFDGPYVAYRQTEKEDHLRIDGLPVRYKSFPCDEVFSPSFWRGFIAGLIATDGHVDDRGSVMVHNRLEPVLWALQTEGSKIGFVTASVKMDREFSPYDDSYKPVYKLTFFRSTIDENDLLRSSHRRHWEDAPKPRQSYIRVESVVPTGRVEDVFCCVEPETHSFTIEAGYLTGNCFVIPDPPDSRSGIFDSAKLWGEIMARGGGCGINLSSLRPCGSYIKSVNGHSSGPCAWAELYSVVTGDVISQGGTRRGAAMLMLWDWHPDIEQFIARKSEMIRSADSETLTPRWLQHANISVCVSDAFMEAVERDTTWDLCFPDQEDHHYKAEWDGDLARWQAKGYAYRVHKTLRARDLFRLICTSAWRSAEPGLVFLERCQKLHPGRYFEQPRATNPCGEQPLPPYGVCNLGSMNLSAYASAAGVFDFARFESDVKVAVRFLDDAIDLSTSFLKENEEVQRRSRRVGLGTMGLADCLLKMQLRYGSPEALPYIDEIYRSLKVAAYEASCELAREKGSFPALDLVEHLAAPFVQGLPDALRGEIAIYGLRNSVLLTQAPTGTTSLLAGVSSGIEPVFSWTTRREDRTGSHLMKHWWIAAWDKKSLGYEGGFPSYAVTSHGLTPLEHLAVQATVQRHIDTSISKTVNAPNSHTVADVEQLYLEAYRQGCKGVTYYRDGSRDAVLTPVENTAKVLGDLSPEEAVGLRVVVPAIRSLPEEIRQGPIARPDAGWTGTTFRYKVPTRSGESAKVYLTVNGEGNKPLEVFIVGPTEDRADHDILARTISHALRYGMPVSDVIENCWEVKGFTPLWGNGKRPITCIANAVGKALEDYLNSHAGNGSDPGPAIVDLGRLRPRRPGRGEVAASESFQFPSTGDLCPACAEFSVIREEGCLRCTNCEWSKCG